ncbi:MAG: maleylacetoacetate isomerase [Devosia sp.]|uniref:maleylacetoacetate isomerase n=1 Tax=Devosia sp. TaxID=1871048 RepID=UPI0024CCCD24|nr:maleylacetoacetate isomerase [Devosia sp.]UYN99044.1 MAG: maleylacetoacetate isomerase [Devosia sp.]
MIQLYDYWRSSASYRVRIALSLAGLEWTSVPVDLLAGDNRSSEHLARNPQGLVPVLDIGNVRLTQSLAIIEYLNEVHGLGLLPADPVARARTRAIAYAVAVDIHPVCNISVVQYAAEHSGDPTLNRTWMQHFIGKGLAAVEEMIDGGAFCIGESISMADVCLYPQLYNAQRWSVSLGRFPRIRAVMETLSEIGAFAQQHPDQAKAPLRRTAAQLR